MGFFQAILDAIANNYIFFVAITIFLILSLIGFYVDKKTRKDADITPIFGTKVSLNIKRKDPSAKKEKKAKGKGKKTFTTTIVGGEDPAPAGVATAASQNATAINNQAPQSEQNVPQTAMVQNPIQAQEPQQIPQGINAYVGDNSQVNTIGQTSEVVQTLPDGTPIDPSLFENIPGTPATQSVMPAAETAQIADTILPNVATTAVQAQSQGIASTAPGMESIMPNIQSQNLEQASGETYTENSANMNMENEDDTAMNLNMNTEEDSTAMNFNMSEE